MVTVDQSLKDELRRCHFHMGHAKADFNTANRSHFQSRDEVTDNSPNKFAQLNKRVSVKVGSDRVVYDSESNIKFISPLLAKNKS